MNPRVPVEVQPTSDWDPSLYMKFADERMLAARDLLARVPLASARLVYDLGCGPGNSAELLSRRFPDADIGPPHPSLRHRRDRQRKLALQEPRLSCPAPTGFRDVTIGSGPMPRKPIGEKAMTDAERQARYRAARAADAPVIRTRRLADHRSRARSWQDVVTQLTELQAQYADWLEALPANQHDSALAEALQ